MEKLTVKQIVEANFTVSPHSPVIKPFGGSTVVADPSLLTPDMCHDNKYHMFLHTQLGVYQFVSDDGVNFTRQQKVVGRAMRPNINRVGDTYYLFYERIRPLFFNALNLVKLAQWKSDILRVCGRVYNQSKDLIKVINESGFKKPTVVIKIFSNHTYTVYINEEDDEQYVGGTEE